MTDQAELQAKIAALQGRINKRKQHHPPQRGGHHFTQHASHGNARWTPFDRASRPPLHQPHRNRVLVLGSGQHGAVDREPATPNAPSTPACQEFAPGQMVTAKQPDPVVVPVQKQSRPVPAPSTRANPTTSVPPKPTKPAGEPPRELVIDGIRFQIHAGGSKLIRITGGCSMSCKEEKELSISDSTTAAKETPKTAKVADVQFLRTKHGNLIRAAAGKKSRPQVPQCENFTKHGTESYITYSLATLRIPDALSRPPADSLTTPRKSPFAKISSAQALAKPDATAICPTNRPTTCPDYANHGRCANREKNACSLPHVDRAGTLRKAAERQAKTGSENESDVSSSDEDENEGDSDVAEDIEMDDDSHQLSQQQDFIAFS
ncbi:hypothetical protein PRZ48_000375 [Zasmidium cellare]|uniref:C3H1-type domain-containing protein n=1 Tax=Zasmidium cellare TaxID=395010 RepID=A0ABR0EZK5_ZASCE|nr:hypothetical protein PRZ48_000375 [Zasmidium cellare]